MDIGNFTAFDPKSDPPPRVGDIDFSWIVAEARLLLRRRNGRAVRAAHEGLFLTLGQHNLQHQMREGQSLIQARTAALSPVRAELLNAIRAETPQPAIEGLKDPRWSELFAVLALGLAARCATLESTNADGRNQGRFERSFPHPSALECYTESVSAITWAKALNEFERFRDRRVQHQAGRTHKEISAVGGRARHRRSAEIKNLVPEFVDEVRPDESNKREINRLFRRWITKNHLDGGSMPVATSTTYDWIRTHLKKSKL